MPVEFLTDEQAEAYGRFVEEPTRPEMERFCYLDDVEGRLIGKRRGEHSRLGFSLQMCTVRYLGLFLEGRWTCRGQWSRTWPNTWASRTPRW
ncbi:DUF4158 domain-containing protein [Nonomuraea helvata]|uniref:DUF4158 domain-containing protein n=1 Tax=Nonomuraea helvata TaxID=37484 RepID=A0ABV5S3H4_9ACTN